MSSPTVQSAGPCILHTVKTTDCASPMKFIHVVSESWAGYLFKVTACNVHNDQFK